LKKQTRKKKQQKIEKLGHLDSFAAYLSSWAFVAAQTDTSELTLYSPGLCSILLACYAHVVYTQGGLECPDQGQSCAAADCEPAYKQQEAAFASVRVPARYNRQRHRDTRGLTQCHAAYLSRRQ